MPKDRQRRAGVTVLFVLLNLQHSWTNNKNPKLKSCNGTSKQPPPNKTSKQIPNQPTHFHKFVQGKVCSSWFLWRWCYCKATVLHKKLAASFLLYLLCLFCVIFSLLWWQMTDTVLSMTFMPAPCCLSFFICSELLWLLSSCSPGLAVLVWAQGSWVALELGNLCAAAARELPGGGVWGALSEMFMGRWLQRTWMNERE